MTGVTNKYKLTTISCFVGIFVQAIMTNLTAILFIPLMSLYGLTFIDLGILVGINFTAQVLIDIIFSGLIDKIAFKKLVLSANIFSFIGLVLFGLTPLLFKDIFMGIIISTIIFSAASGLLEILLSPIINAIPNENKGPAMSLMHSFYAWGQVLTIIVTTLFIFIFGKNYWQFIVLIWAIVPLINFFMFLNANFPDNVPEGKRQNIKDLILDPFCLIAFGAIFCGAATEIVMNQWSSTFMEKALLFPKVTGDLLGMCGFAVMMGIGRTLYGIYGEKVNINNILVLSSILAAVCYIIVAVSPYNVISLLACTLCGLFASLLWPGTLITTAHRFPLAGAWIFALLAAAGDIGAAFGSYITGLVVDKLSNIPIIVDVSGLMNISLEQGVLRLGILLGAIFPILAFICHIYLKKLSDT